MLNDESSEEVTFAYLLSSKTWPAHSRDNQEKLQNHNRQICNDNAFFHELCQRNTTILEAVFVRWFCYD